MVSLTSKPMSGLSPPETSGEGFRSPPLPQFILPSPEAECFKAKKRAWDL